MFFCAHTAPMCLHRTRNSSKYFCPRKRDNDNNSLRLGCTTLRWKKVMCRSPYIIYKYIILYPWRRVTGSGIRKCNVQYNDAQQVCIRLSAYNNTYAFDIMRSRARARMCTYSIHAHGIQVQRVVHTALLYNMNTYIYIRHYITRVRMCECWCNI